MDDKLCVLDAVTRMAFDDFPNDELAAFNNAIQTIGKCPPYNLAYTRALEALLVNKDGIPFDVEIVQDASAAEVNQRVSAGTFK